MRLVILRSLLVLTAGAAVLVGVLYVASTVDARSPEVLSFALTQPLPDDPDTALITTSLEVAFNEPVQVDAGTVPLTLSPNVEGTASWSGNTLIFTPRMPLDLETEYVATAGIGIRDAAGNRIGDPPPSFTFTTAGRPTVVSTIPEDGSSEIAVEQPIEIAFSTLMDTESVEAGLTVEPGVPHELRWSGEVLEIIPTAPLDPDREYRIRLGATAADVAGVPLSRDLSVTFRTVAPGLEPETMLPADGIGGIAPEAPIALIFDRAIDPESVDDELFTITPDVAGSLEVVSASGDPVDDATASVGRVLRFDPSGALPLNTTFEVSLAPGLRSLDGGSMAETVSWRFTTGAPAATLSNRITFISDRGGVPNVWAMNPDGSGQHQVSTELSPVLDYAVAPDGSRVVIADGRRLVSAMADGSSRSVLTEEEYLEFDPAFSPNGQRLAFGRADAVTGEGLGLWLSSADGGDEVQVELRPQVGASPTPSPPSGEGDGPGFLRVPRFSPDGQALAFVDVSGSLAILELPSERLTRVDAFIDAPPLWLSGSSGVLVTHHSRVVPRDQISAGGLVHPMEGRPGGSVAVGLLSRSGTDLSETALPRGAEPIGLDREGRLGYLDDEGRIYLSAGPEAAGVVVAAAEDVRVVAAAFATGHDAMVLVVAQPNAGRAAPGRLELLDLESGERTVLAERGARPHWLP